MKALIIDRVSEIIPSGIKELGFDVDIKILPTTEELSEIISPYDLLVMRVDPFITKDVLDKATNLKLITVCSVGTNHIDLEYAKAKGIEVRNSPGLNNNAVAELTIGKIFELYRHLISANNEVKYENNWNKYKWPGKELKDDTIGIIGFGKIGQRTAQIAKAIGMKVLPFDILYRPGEQVGDFTMTSLDDIYANSDVITVHVPITPETKYMLGKDEFERMKDGVYVINVARGGVVNEDELFEFLKSGKVAGYSLDCLEAELTMGGMQTDDVYMESKLFELNNVYASPHIGGSTKDAFDAIGRLVLRNIKEVFDL